MKLTCRCCGKKFESEKIGPPFCSERCRLMDLGAWASQKYRIAGAVVKDEAQKQNDSDEE